MYKISDDVIKFIENTMKYWTVDLPVRGKTLAKVKIQREIFQGDALLPLIFVIVMMSLNHILRKCTGGYRLHNPQEKIDHLMDMDNIKQFAENEKEFKTLIQVVRIYNDDIGIEFGLEKCDMLDKKRKTINDGINRTTKSRKNQNTWRKRNLQILGNIGVDTIKQMEMKEKNQKRVPQENEKIT